MKNLIPIILILFCCSYGWCDEIDDLIPCIIQVESGGNPNAVSSKGAIGLCQLTNIALEDLNKRSRSTDLVYGIHRDLRQESYYIEDMFNPRINILCCKGYLRYLKNHYLKQHYSLETLLGSWNWGIGNVRKVDYDYNRFPKSVKRYIRKILKLYRGEQ